MDKCLVAEDLLYCTPQNRTKQYVSTERTIIRLCLGLEHHAMSGSIEQCMLSLIWWMSQVTITDVLRTIEFTYMYIIGP